MKETLIDMILQFFGKKKDDKELPHSLLELLTTLKNLQPDSQEVIETEQQFHTKFVQVRKQSDTAIRHYTQDECCRLGIEGLRLLNFLENNHIIDDIDREGIIQMTMESEMRVIDLDHLKYNILLVASEQAPSKLYMEWLKYLLFNSASSVLH